MKRRCRFDCPCNRRGLAVADRRDRRTEKSLNGPMGGDRDIPRRGARVHRSPSFRAVRQTEGPLLLALVPPLFHGREVQLS
jgi:hypothetical protein